MQPIWLIEDFDPDDSRLPLIEEVKRQGLRCEVIKYLPFESGSYDLIEDSPNSCVIFQGSLNLARQLRREKKWVPGVWCDLDNFRCRTYYPYFGEHLLNSDYFFIPVFDLKRRKNELYDMLGIDDCLFIRPDSGFKTFAGRVVRYDEFNSDYEFMSEYSDRDALAVISSPKPIDAEFRFVICKKKVVTGCIYKSDGELVTNNSENEQLDLLYALKYAENVAKTEWEPEPIYVMDICLSNDEYKLLEINSFSCSGLYGCQLAEVVKAASDLAVEINKEENEITNP